MQPVNTTHRLAAISLALSITFGIVLALSDYAYAAPSPMVGKAVPANPCQ